MHQEDDAHQGDDQALLKQGEPQIVDRSLDQVIQTMADVAKDMSEDETFYSNAKAKELLGFDPQHDWRHYLDS